MRSCLHVCVCVYVCVCVQACVHACVMCIYVAERLLPLIAVPCNDYKFTISFNATKHNKIPNTILIQNTTLSPYPPVHHARRHCSTLWVSRRRRPFHATPHRVSPTSSAHQRPDPSDHRRRLPGESLGHRHFVADW